MMHTVIKHFNILHLWIYELYTANETFMLFWRIAKALLLSRRKRKINIVFFVCVCVCVCKGASMKSLQDIPMLGLFKIKGPYQAVKVFSR